MLDHATELTDNPSWPIPTDDVSDQKSLSAPTIVSHPQLVDNHHAASRPVSPNVPQLQPDRLPSLSPLPPEMVGNTDPEPPSADALSSTPSKNLLQAPADASEAMDRLTPLTNSAVDDEERNSQVHSDGENGEMATEIDEGYQSGGNSPDGGQETLSKVETPAPEPAESPLVEQTVSEESSQDIKVDSEPGLQAPAPAETANASVTEKKPEESTVTNTSSSEPPQPVASTSSAATPTSPPNPPAVNGDDSSIPESPSNSSKPQVTELDPKVAVLLELNAEMIKYVPS